MRSLKRIRTCLVLLLLTVWAFQGFFVHLFQGVSQVPVTLWSVSVSTLGKAVSKGEWTASFSTVSGSKSLSVTLKGINSTDSRVRFLLWGIPLVSLSSLPSLAKPLVSLARSPVFPIPVLRDWFVALFSPFGSSAASVSSMLLSVSFAIIVLSISLSAIQSFWNKSQIRYFCSGISPPQSA